MFILPTGSLCYAQVTPNKTRDFKVRNYQIVWIYEDVMP